VRARSPWVVVAALAVSAAWATGCEKIFGIGELPYPPEGGVPDATTDVEVGPPPGDGGVEADTRTPVDSGTPVEGGEAGPVCTPVLPYTPVPWKPPTAFMQPACTMSQLNAYQTCFPDCDNFRQDPANAACVSCIETDENAVAHGPVITAAMGGEVVPVEVNIGGCQAHEDGVSTPGCCGQQENDSLGCLSTECGTCSDFKDPAPGGPASTCEGAATMGACATYVPMPSCDAELDGGVASMCTSLAGFLPTWCAPPGPPPTCYANMPFTAPTWEPPTPFGQPACTPAQVSAYLTCFPSCSSFVTDPSNTACAACIQTDMASTQYGPIVTSGGMPIQVNFGGCIANLDGNTAAGSCGDVFNSFNACLSTECATCSDFDDPTPGGPTQLCTENAFNGGFCTAYNDMTCDSEVADAGVAAVCDNLNDFLPLWCEGIAVDAGDGGE
jgi:hypothetical protein